MLSWRFPALFVRQRLAPVPVLWVGSIAGMLVCLATIVVTLLSSWLPTLIPTHEWWLLVGGLTLLWLVVCTISSMLATSEAHWEQWQDDAVSPAPAIGESVPHPGHPFSLPSSERKTYL